MAGNFFTNSVLAKSRGLCDGCSEIDFSPLETPLPKVVDGPRDAASTYEEKLAIYINEFSVHEATEKSTQCLLCALLAKCASLTGESKRLLKVRCCIRPKLRWSLASQTSGGQGITELKHTGQIHVWFHEIKSYNKAVSPPAQSPNLAAAIGAWRRSRLLRVPKPSLKKSPHDSQLAEPSDPSPSSEENQHASADLDRILLKNRPGVPRTTGMVSRMFTPKPLSQQSSSQSRLDEIPDGESAEDSDGNTVSPRRIAIKPRPPFNPPLPVISLKSAIASWMIDVVGQDTGLKVPRRISISAIADITQLSGWLDDCDNSHSHPYESHTISPRMNRVLARRVLRLINTSTGNIETHESVVKFVALSYVWGQSVNVTPTLQSKPIAEHAPTIRDAAELTSSMGIQWLWVDRICIDQNNEEEKTFLIPYIKDIFAAAQLTIIAASGNGAHTGLPGTKRTPRTPGEIEIPSKIKCGKDMLELLPARPSFNALLEPCVWRTRGWTFEEQVFSRRVLYVFPSEIIFSCCKGTFRESSGSFTTGAAGSMWGDAGATPPIVASEINAKVYAESTNDSPMISGREFVRAVEEYTKRSLTVEEDRVAAFAGLMSITTGLQDEVPERPLLKHGHPLEFFETALTWQFDEKSERRYPKFGKPFAPSWSWASAGTKAHFLDNGEDNDRSCWFDFKLLGGYDVLGLPRQNAGLSGRLGLSKPMSILESQPWMGAIEALPAYAREPGMERFDLVLDLPKLHLVTVIFEALFASHDGHEGQDSLRAVDYQQSRDQIIFGRLSINRSERVRLQTPTRTLFAIVAGNLNIYVMALKPEPGDNTYSRMGLLRVSFYSDQLFFEIMRRGHPRWEYIRLV